MAKTVTINADSSTEEKIKQAARLVFYKKGFAATRTRDIADEAGMNLALLNYYFRSKAKLFEIIILEALSDFFDHLIPVLNNQQTTLEEKIETMVSMYIDLLATEPEIPLFILSELRSNPEFLANKMPLQQIFTNSFFIKQYMEGVEKGNISEPNPVHFIMNLMGLIVFPVVARPMLMKATKTSDAAFNKILEERKKLIPKWIKAILGS